MCLYILIQIYKRDLKLLSKYIQNKIRIVKSTAKLRFETADALYLKFKKSYVLSLQNALQ